MEKGTTENLPAHTPSVALSILDKATFEQAFRVARVFAASALVPKHFQGKESDCFIAVQMALRLDVDPFMLMQNMYVVFGRPGFEGKFVIALINARGPYKDPLQFEYLGEGDTRSCTAWGIRKDTGVKNEMKIDMALAKRMGWLSKSDSMWLKMPDQMLAYRSASWLANLYCPEVKMGMPTADELRDSDIIDVTPAGPSLQDRVNAAKVNGNGTLEAPKIEVDTATGEVKEPSLGEALDAAIEPKPESRGIPRPEPAVAENATTGGQQTLMATTSSKSRYLAQRQGYKP